MKKDYHPIDCNFHDELLQIAIFKKEVEISFQQEKKRKTISGKIVDVYSKEGAEYLQTDKGIHIRLDHLLSVNGKKLIQ